MFSRESFGSLFRAATITAGEALAAGTGDNTKVTGQTIDRLGFRSGSVLISMKTVLAEAATLTIAIEIQESDDGSTWDTAEVIQAATTVETGNTGGSTEYPCLKVDDKFESRKRYIRYNITPNLSASGTDTVHWGAVCILGDAFEVPVE